MLSLGSLTGALPSFAVIDLVHWNDLAKSSRGLVQDVGAIVAVTSIAVLRSIGRTTIHLYETLPPGMRNVKLYQSPVHQPTSFFPVKEMEFPKTMALPSMSSYNKYSHTNHNLTMSENQPSQLDSIPSTPSHHHQQQHQQQHQHQHQQQHRRLRIHETTPKSNRSSTNRSSTIASSITMEPSHTKNAPLSHHDDANNINTIWKVAIQQSKQILPIVSRSSSPHETFQRWVEKIQGANVATLHYHGGHRQPQGQPQPQQQHSSFHKAV
jgi:hypothetical protein